MAKKKKSVAKKVAAKRDDGPVVHSAYRLHSSQIDQDLQSGNNAKQLQELFGEEVYEKLRTLAGEAGRTRSAAAGQTKVLILPGIMGSTLGIPGGGMLGSNDVIWLDPFDIARGELMSLTMSPPRPKVSSLDVFPLAYTLLRLRLRIAGFDADFFPFDWRQSLDVLGSRLAKQIAATSANEVCLVAHSMGGLVARAGLAALTNQDKVKRIVMLGTPNYGSFVPIEAMRGVYPTLQQVAALDFQNSADELARKVFRTMPGLCQLLPWPEKFSAVNLYDPQQWPTTKPVPDKKLLDDARRVQQQLPLGDERFTLIAGVNKFTIVGVRVENNDFVEQLSLAGDGTVPLEMAKLPNVPTYHVEESHGSLQNNSAVIRAVTDILHSGSTTTLPMHWTQPRASARSVRQSSLVVPTVRVAAEQVSHRDLRNMLRELAAPPTAADVAVAAPTAAAPVASFPVRLAGVTVSRLTQQRLDIRLAKGSITEVDSRAIVLGVFREVAPTGAARAVDQRLDGAITEFTQRRMVDGHVGEVFVMPAGRKMLRAELAVLVGLGAFDELNASTLQVVAENTIRTMIRTNVEEFATVLLGSGSGTDIEASLQNLLVGFIRGLKDADHRRRFRGITLCELDAQRFDTLRAALFRLTGTSLFQDLQVTFDEMELPTYEPAPSAPRAVAAPDDPVYLIVRAAGGGRPDLEATHGDPLSGAALRRTTDTMTFDVSVLTAGAKAAVISDTKDTPAAELNEFLETLAVRRGGPTDLPQFGKELGNKTLPPSVIKALLEMRHRRLVVVNDAESSRMPWETLCLDDGHEGWFPAADAGLSRRYLAQNLSVAKWLEQRRTQMPLEVLLIFNPNANDAQFSLPGAEKEGARIQKLLSGNAAVKLSQLHGAAATRLRLLEELQSGKYDVIHYAGHAFFDPTHRSRSGLLCSDKQILSGADCASLGKLPALVFFNACESVRTRDAASAAAAPGPKTIADSLELNVSLAEAFLRGGVANYLGLYWPVEDDPATAFAGKFYEQVIAGATMGAAVSSARAAVRELKSVDWCDYVLYGDDNFALKRVAS